jgi:hypothetical protein
MEEDPTLHLLKELHTCGLYGSWIYFGATLDVLRLCSFNQRNVQSMDAGHVKGDP